MKLKTFAVVLIMCIISFMSPIEAAEFEMVSYSAHVKLQWLAASGIPEAQMYLKYLEKPNFFNKGNLPDFERIEKVNSLFQEINYSAANNFIKSNGYKNVFDVASSYSPRVIESVKNGDRYVVAELAAVAEIADKLAKKSLDAGYYDKFSYEVALVEDEDAMTELAAKFEGKVCIVENGLMVYLTKERADKMFKNVRKILESKGGCMITTDLLLKEYFSDTAAAVYDEKNAGVLFDETKKCMKKSSTTI